MNGEHIRAANEIDKELQLLIKTIERKNTILYLLILIIGILLFLVNFKKA